MRNDDRIRELLLSQEEGALRPGEAQELEDLLTNDPDGGRLLVEHYVFTSELESELGCAEDSRAQLATLPTIRHAVARYATASAPAARTQRSPWQDRRVRTGLGVATVTAAAAFALLVGKADRPGRHESSAPVGGVVAEAPTATVREFHGTVDLLTPAGPLATVVGAAVAEGTTVDLGPDGTAVLEMRDGTQLRLGPRARMTIAAPATGADGATRRLVRLDEGALSAVVSPQRPGQFLVFGTPHVRATVLGTELSVRIDDEVTHVSVSHGRVLFEDTHDGTTMILGAGQEASSHKRAAAPEAAVQAVQALGADASHPSGASWDFEDGVLPPIFIQGQIAPGPPRSGNRFAVTGVLYGVAGDKFTVGIESPQVWIQYADTASVSFDYWLPTDGAKVAVQVWDRDQGQNHSLVITNVTHEAWTHLEVRIADFHPNVDKTRPLKDGDAIDQLYILGGRLGGGPFFVDNIRIWDGR